MGGSKMASIKDVSLKAVKKTLGIEGEGFLANIYLQSKKIGTVADYGDGGCYHICIEKESDVLENIVRTYYSQRPEVDGFKLKSVEEYVERKKNGTLPYRDYTNADIYMLYEYFFNKIYQLYCIEQELKKAVKVSYVYIPGIPLPLDKIYYTNGSKKVFDDICKHEKNEAVVFLRQYSNLEDFNY